MHFELEAYRRKKTFPSTNGLQLVSVPVAANPHCIQQFVQVKQERINIIENLSPENVVAHRVELLQGFIMAR